MKSRGIGKRILKFFLVLGLLMTMMGLIVGLTFFVYVNRYVEKSIDESLFTMIGSDSASKIYYYETSETSGEKVAKELTDEELYGEYRCIFVSYEEIPKYLKDAFVSIEDKRFYDHSGVDWKRTCLAGVNYFLKFNGNFGGSTITQQLIKNVTDKDEYSFQRKIQEIFWALDLETKMSKREILGLYLNIINLSQGCYGVGAAANYYFSKDISELTLNECACIAAITNNPSYYDPIRNPEHNRERKNLILKEMYEQGYIDENEYAESTQNDVVLCRNSTESDANIHSWYADMVIEDVIGDLMSQRGYSRAMANLMIYTGGLRIYTTMDPEIQEILEEYYSEIWHFSVDASDNLPQSAMMVIDPTNGNILGVAGAVGKKQANRLQNFATQTVRPAGSVIKPLSVYAPALDSGLITWGSVYDDVPVNFGDYNLDSEAGEIRSPVPWPKNSDGLYRGLTNVNDALERSVNTVTVKILQDFGVSSSFDFLYRKLHLTSLIEEGYDADGNYITDCDLASLALGQMNYGLSVREVTAAYSIFPNSGIYNFSRTYDKVTDYAGSVLLENRYRGEAVIGEDSACVMNFMLQNVVKNGTAKSLSLQNHIDCAGKTGTTQNNYDRWYIGYTPYYIGGVWYGYEYPQSLSGSNRCLTIWDDVMTKIHETKLDMTKKSELKHFELTDGVTVCEYCSDSGLPVTNACLHDPRGERREIGYFVRGNEPSGYCNVHVPVAYDAEEGGVCLYHTCPEENVRYVGLIFVRRSFPTQIYVTDAQYVWRELGENTAPELSPTLPFFAKLLNTGEYCGISKSEKQYNRICGKHGRYSNRN